MLHRDHIVLLGLGVSAARALSKQKEPYVPPLFKDHLCDFNHKGIVFDRSKPIDNLSAMYSGH
jgi:hypothetical protein